MSRLGLLCLLICTAVCAAQFGRTTPRGRARGLIRGRGRVRGGFAGSQDCLQAFQTPTNNQFCTTYVNQCGNIFDNPQNPQAATCASCIFVWMTQCPQTSSG